MLLNSLTERQLNRHNMKRSLSFLLLLSTTIIEGSFYISTEKSKWLEQNRSCIAYTPEVKAAADTDYQVVETLDRDFTDNGSVWVGYYQVERVFEYIGCGSFKTLFNNYEERAFVEIKGNPGHCFPGCDDDTVIGVTKTRCYCLGSDFNLQNLTETECTDKCDSPAVACGKHNNPMEISYLSIYKINTDVTVSTISGAAKEKNCIAMYSDIPKPFHWEKCSWSLVAMCSYGEFVRNVSVDYYSWITAANKCFQLKAHPTTYSNSKTVDQRINSNLWTGMFKTNVTYEYNADIPANRRYDPMKYGYLTVDPDSNAKLRFTETNSERRTLCAAKGDKKVTRSRKWSFSQESVTTAFSDFSVPTEANVTDISTKSSLDIYLAIGVCVSVVIISVIIVTLTCFFVRRKKNRRHEKTNPSPGNETEVPAQDSCQRDNSYFVLEPQENTSLNKNETYDIAIDELEFDSKKNNPNYSKINTENVYNHLDNETTYDHANIQGNRSMSNENETDETYDQCTAKKEIKCDVRHTDNIYNQGGEILEDEYNHLGPPARKLNTDNVYGVHD